MSGEALLLELDGDKLKIVAQRVTNATETLLPDPAARCFVVASVPMLVKAIRRAAIREVELRLPLNHAGEAAS